MTKGREPQEEEAETPETGRVLLAQGRSLRDGNEDV